MQEGQACIELSGRSDPLTRKIYSNPGRFHDRLQRFCIFLPPSIKGKPMAFKRKDLLGIRDLETHEIEHILELAFSLKEINTRPIKKVPTLRGKTIVHLFYEPSTRTRTSFDIAAKRLSADTYSITASTSSMVKGETALDTLKNLEAMKPDIFVIRHSASGTCHRLAQRTTASVINAARN